jgi:hypothetical protein
MTLSSQMHPDEHGVPCDPMGNDPIESVSSSSRHHWANGLYLLGLDLYPDRLALRVFTSRRVSTVELMERLTLSDTMGSSFTMRTPEEEYLDGRGVLDFEPAPPSGLVGLTLRDASGSALFTFSSDGMI